MLQKSLLKLTCSLFLLILPVMVFSQVQGTESTELPWYILLPFTIFGFVFGCIYRLLFSFWGWLIIIFIIYPFVKDRLWMMNRKRSFLGSQKSALINPRDADARYQLGMIYFKGKNYNQAEHYLREAVSIDNTNTEYLKRLADILRLRKKYKEAVEIYKKVLELKDTVGYGETQLGLGNCYRGMNDIKEARYWFEKSVELNSSLAEPYFKLALLTDKMGEKTKKDSLINECRQITANSPPFLQKRNRKWGFYASIYPIASIFFK